jgi:hypothetical protein
MTPHKPAMHTLRSLWMWASPTWRGQETTDCLSCLLTGVSAGPPNAPHPASKAQVGLFDLFDFVPGHTASFLPLDCSSKVFFRDLTMNRSALLKRDGNFCLLRRTPRVNLSFNISLLQGFARSSSTCSEACSDSENLIESRHLYITYLRR